MGGFGAPRRRLLTGAGILGGGMLLAAGGIAGGAEPGRRAGQEKEVGAVEDLMREHGVLRRVLCVYTESALRLRGGARVDPRPLNQAAQLFRNFGENYHERLLEEAHIFPAVRQAAGPAAALVPVLFAQHQRGREVTGYILGITGRGIGTADVAPLARAFETFVLMYRNHTAREDTVVFPAWKTDLPERRLHEMGELFEDIERRQFGRDGFEDAVMRIAGIEGALGLADLARFTAPPPPKQ